MMRFLNLHSPLLQFAQQPVEPALLARGVEAGPARAVEERDAGEDGRERLLLAPLFGEQRRHALRQVAEVAEAERGGQVGQRSRVRGRRREGESHVGQRHLPAVLEGEHQVRRGPQRRSLLLDRGELVPAQPQLLAGARLEKPRAEGIGVLDRRHRGERPAGELQHPGARRFRSHAAWASSVLPTCAKAACTAMPILPLCLLAAISAWAWAVWEKGKTWSSTGRILPSCTSWL